jgi:hypothetical protein
MKRPAWLSLLWLVLVPVAGAIEGPREFDWGFIASRQVDVHGDLRLRVLGPIYENALSPDGKTLAAVRPLHAVVRDPVGDSTHRDVLWPVATAKTVHENAAWRVLLAYGFNDDRGNPYSRRKFWLLPFWFEGRDEGGGRYFALFPVGGVIHDFLFLDSTAFVLWPLYVHSTRKDLTSNTLLWPLLSRTKGERVTRQRVFPLYGRSVEAGRQYRSFVLWPFWTYGKSLKPGRPANAWVLWPLAGRMASSDQRTWMVLPPFFRWTLGERQNVVHAPWPLYQRGEGLIPKTYLWPLWGTRRGLATRSTFILWPFIKFDETDRGSTMVYRRRVAPFVFSDKVVPVKDMPGGAGEVAESRFKLWPLFSVETEGDAYRYRALELWPLRMNPPPIERSWAAWWTLWSKTGKGADSDTELLWGLYRNRVRDEAYRETSLFPLVSWKRDERQGDERELMFLKGLVGYRRQGTHKSLRLLYFIRLGGKEETP